MLEVGRGHDQALAVNEHLPPPDEVKADIATLEDWLISRGCIGWAVPARPWDSPWRERNPGAIVHVSSAGVALHTIGEVRRFASVEAAVAAVG